MSAESRIHPSDATIPTVTAATMPCQVVPGQKRSITRAGRFALAAMLKAQPTRKLTLKSRKMIPSPIAMIPRATAASLPQRTFSWSVSRTPKTFETRSWATAPLPAMMRPLTVPSTVVNAIAEMIANSVVLNDFASNGAAMFESVGSSTPEVIAPRPR